MIAGATSGGNEKTDFSSLTGSFTIKNGVLSNQDLELVGPLVRAKGSGTVDIGKRTIAYRLEPKIVASLQGQGGSKDMEGLTLPFQIQGSWDRMQFLPEFDKILQDPNKTLQQLQNLGGGLGKIIGGDGNQGPSSSNGKSAPDQPSAKPEDIIKQLVPKLFNQ